MKINIKQVLPEAFSVYTKNFKSLAVISFFMALFTVAFTAVNLVQRYMTYTNEKEALVAMGLSLVMTAVLILVIVFMPKLYLSMPILINSLFYKKSLSVGEAYRQTRGKYWTYVGYSFLMGLCAMPALVLSLSKIPFISLLIPLNTSLVNALFYTLIPMIAIEPTTVNCLKKSVGLIKGNYLPVLALVLITTTAVALIERIFTALFAGEFIALLIIGLVHAVVYFFVFPFSNIVSVIVYKQLSISARKENR